MRQALRNLFDPPAAILLYHRVACPAVDPWGISVRPKHFKQQLEVLRRLTVPVTLKQIQEHGPRGRKVALTFDDGYADNLFMALPLLEQFEIPATVFVASGYIGQARAFWWDELGHLLLHGRSLPDTLRLRISNTPHTWTLPNDPAPVPLAAWRTGITPPAGPRAQVYTELYDLLRALEPAAREAILSVLRDWAGPATGQPDPFDRPLTQAELSQLAAHPLIEIGAHTVMHPPLGDLGPAAQRIEIGPDRIRLERLTGQPVTSFSFPFGSFTPESPGLVAEAGFARACISAGQPVRRHTRRFALPRCSVEDWDGEAFATRLRYWL